MIRLCDTNRRDRGSATVYAIVLATMIGVMAVVAVQCVALARIQHKAASAADLAALAASRAAQQGRDGCGEAQSVAKHNAAELRDCEMSDAVATVTVQIESPPMWGRTWEVAQRARAAPGDYVLDTARSHRGGG